MVQLLTCVAALRCDRMAAVTGSAADLDRTPAEPMSPTAFHPTQNGSHLAQPNGLHSPANGFHTRTGAQEAQNGFHEDTNGYHTPHTAASLDTDGSDSPTAAAVRPISEVGGVMERAESPPLPTLSSNLPTPAGSTVDEGSTHRATHAPSPLARQGTPSKGELNDIKDTVLIKWVTTLARLPMHDCICLSCNSAIGSAADSNVVIYPRQQATRLLWYGSIKPHQHTSDVC